MLDNKDINKLKSVFATKKDLKNLATRSDVQKTVSDSEDRMSKLFVTKKDLSDTEDRMSKLFATKKDLSDSEDRMSKLFATKKDLQEVRIELKDMKELLQGLLVAADSIAKSIGELKLEYAAISTQLSRHDRWIKQIADKVGVHLVAE